MSTAVWELQRAIYNALTNDAAVQIELGTPARVFDDAPDNAAFPFLTIGETRSRDYQGIDGAIEHEVRLYAWSRYAGRREIKRIFSTVYDALHERNLNLPDHHLINMRFVFADVLRRQDGETYQGVARYRALTQPQ